MGESQEYVLPPPILGVDTRTYSVMAPKGSYANIENYQYGEGVGAFVSRYGHIERNATLFNTTKWITGGVIFKYGDPVTPTVKLVVMSYATLYKSDLGGNNVFTSVKTGFTGGLEPWFAQTEDYLFVTNGADTIQRYDGTAIRDAGFPAPSTNLAVAVGAAGVLTGAYQYKYTAVYDSNNAHESSASAVSSTLTLAAEKGTLTSIDTVTNATARNIFRTKAGGTSFFFLATIADNSTTTYTDNIADADLGVDQAPTDNGIPPDCHSMVLWRGRMCMANTTANPNRLFLSAILNTEKDPRGGVTKHGAGVEIFPAENYIDVGDDNTPIRSLAVFQDQLVVLKEDTVWNFQGDIAQNMTLWKSAAASGCIAPKTVVSMSGALFYLGNSEGMMRVYAYNGSDTEVVSLPIEEILRTDIALKALIPLTSLRWPQAVKYRGCYLLSYEEGTQPSGKVAIYDTNPPSPRWIFEKGGEALSWIPAFGYTGSTGSDLQGKLYYGSDRDSRILIYDHRGTGGLVDYNRAANTPITGIIETQWLDLDAGYHLKQINWIDIFGKQGPDPAKGETDPGDTLITCARTYDFDTVENVTNCNALNLTTANKHMDRPLFHHRIHCEGEGATTPEICYLMKMKITTVGPIEIFRVVVNYTPESPEITHDQQ